ncbi:MAG: autotransporter domain-containing protein [Phenylobacterium sp.]|uniref:autotransporter domain-containing protein n=1 Tax=Phenylobacterium sp. TaxID=1871053 RepID=UPI0025D0EE38|nr:autotransporter domain-containing protein [Phenylobacterium sp.]MBI1200147.1 autotransporter domain-containing protein [Phenylobacterium sp.]
MFRVGAAAIRPTPNPEAPVRRWIVGAFATTAIAMALAPEARAQSLVLQGDYLKLGLNQQGTLGTGGTTQPGILYDGAGSGTFNPSYDYLTPGSPMEGFVLQGTTSGGAFTATNNNASLGSAQVTGALSDYSGVAFGGETFDQRAVWTGTYGATLGVTHDYRFNTDGQQLQIVTTITALTDITGLNFVRFTDPDAVAAPGDTSATNNFQGSGSISGDDLIYAEATVSKYVIGLYSTDATTHLTGAPGFTAAPAGYLAGTFLGNGDYTIGMAFTIGDLLNGESITLSYAYIFGTDIAAAIVASGGGGGGGGADPEPPRNIEEGGQFSTADLMGGSLNPVFDGGALKSTEDASVNLDFTITAKGGSIDTGGHNLVLSGVVSGAGRLVKTGEGVLELSGANSFLGVTVNQGVLAIGADSALGASGAGLIVDDGGVIRATSDTSILRAVTLSGGTATFDTRDHDLVISGAIDGAGGLEKAGAGVLTLSGENSYTGDVRISGGGLRIASVQSLGSGGGTLDFADGTGLIVDAGMVLGNRINVGSGLATVDVAGDSLRLNGALTGDGGIVKAGSGTLTLEGSSTLRTLQIDAGTVVATSTGSLGASDGRIVLGGGTRLTTANDLAIDQSVDFAGADAVIDTGANNVVVNGTISGDNCLIKAGSGSLNLLAPGANAIGACVEEGTLKFNSVFTGNVTIDSAGTGAGSGLIHGDVMVAGVLAPGNSPGRLVIDGGVTLASSGVLSIDIDGPTAGIGAGHFDTLVLTGANGVFNAAGAISPITRGITGDATNTYVPHIGETFQVVTAEGGVAGRFERLVQPTAGMAANSRFEVIYRPDAIILAVTPESYAAAAGGVANAVAVGGAVDALRDAGSTGFSDGLIGLNEAQIGGVLQLAAGEAHADTAEAVLRGNRGERRLVLARAGQTTVDQQVWGSLSGGTREVGADDVAGRYRDDRIGVMIGADRRVANVRVGGALSYGEAEIKAGPSGGGRAFSYQAMAYAGWREGPWYVSGVIQGGKDTYKTTRRLGAASAYAKPEGASYAADVEAGRTFALAPAAVTVIAGLSKDRVDRDRVTESGDATVALSFDRLKRDAAQARLGLRLERPVSLGQASLKPYASAFVLQELDGSRTRLDAALQGAAFEVASSSPGRTALELATGFEAKVGARGRVRLDYRYEGAREAQAHALSLTAVMAW